MPFTLELTLDFSTLAILIMVAFTAGFIDAIAGGGGLLTIPALLTAGLPPHLVLGTNKLCATFGAATASYTFYRRRLFEPGLWRRALVGTTIGAGLGAALAQFMPASWLNQALPLVVSACGIYLLFSRLPEASASAAQRIGRNRQWPQSLSLGFYDGVAGPGTGAFWTVSSLLLYPLDLLRASGVARTMNFVSNAVALAVFIIGGHVAWVLGIGMGLALMGGAYLGAHTAIRGGSRFIRPVFILVVLAMSLRLAWQHWVGTA
ncbi:TSUP family transporter [Pseudomonas sp.]|uniref:TSUP family transporter n=1 Tax=Pseudomonas sp. TaxID=306 RepID=UPI003D10453A